MIAPLRFGTHEVERVPAAIDETRLLERSQQVEKRGGDATVRSAPIRPNPRPRRICASTSSHMPRRSGGSASLRCCGRRAWRCWRSAPTARPSWRPRPPCGASFRLAPPACQGRGNLFLAPPRAPCGSAGRRRDRFGGRLASLAGLALFALASCIIATAATQTALLAGRSLQGLAAAFAVPSTLAAVDTSAAPERRGAAIGAWTGFLMLGFSIGPL